MKNVHVTYCAEIMEYGVTWEGEAGLVIPMQDGTADTLIQEYGKPGVFLSSVAYVENLLTIAEKLRGRRYVPGSIKGFREVQGGTT